MTRQDCLISGVKYGGMFEKLVAIAMPSVATRLELADALERSIAGTGGWDDYRRL